MYNMIRLSDAELQIVVEAARPIAPRLRDSFLRTIASELANLGDQLGPGSITRIVRMVQKQFYDPPLDLGDDAV
jgi:hypothetical protein